MEFDSKKLSENIALLRGKWTVAHAAEVCKIPYRTFQAIELGNRIPRLDNVIAIARGFKVSLGELTGAAPEEYARSVAESRVLRAFRLTTPERQKLILDTAEAFIPKKDQARNRRSDGT